MKVIGLTGGIASGKSMVSKMLKGLGAIIIDADKIAREVVMPGSPALKRIEEEFGSRVLKEDGTLDRKLLGTIVFSNDEMLNTLNDITHPEIRSRISEGIEHIKKTGGSVAVIDAAVLIESGMQDMADEIWMVFVDHETQMQRLMQRDNISEEEAEKRIRSQMPAEEKAKYCDKIIDNTKNIEITEEQVYKLWNNITN